MKPRQPAYSCTVPISEESESYSGDERASGIHHMVTQSPSLFVSEGFFIFSRGGQVKRVIQNNRKKEDGHVLSDDGLGGDDDFFLPIRNFSLFQSGEIRCETMGSHRTNI